MLTGLRIALTWNGGSALRRQRVFRDRLQPLDIYDDVELIKRYRMPRHVLLKVIDFIRDQVEHPTKRSHATPATLQIITALRFFAECSFQLTSGDLSGISQPSTSRIVTRVATALQRISPQIIRFPRNIASQNAIKEGFYDERRRRIPNVLGCLDGSLVEIKCPARDEGAYICRHNYHAIKCSGGLRPPEEVHQYCCPVARLDPWFVYVDSLKPQPPTSQWSCKRWSPSGRFCVPPSIMAANTSTTTWWWRRTSVQYSSPKNPTEHRENFWPMENEVAVPA